MATYVDGFVLAISKKQLPAYKKMAKEGRTIWMKYGALDYKECMADDMTPKHVKLPFPKMVGAKPTEVVFFSYIVFKSKAHRNQVNKKVMAYFDEKYKDEQPDVDMRRFAYGGFTTVVE
jgi:alkaline phosphatase